MIVVIGGTGNVGSKVISNLRDSNTPYLAIQSANGATEGYRKGNLMDLVFLNEVLSEAKPCSQFCRGLSILNGRNIRNC